MSWNKFVEFIAPFKIPTEIAVSVVLLVALFLSFAPENLLVQLKLLEFIKEYQEYDVDDFDEDEDDEIYDEDEEYEEDDEEKGEYDNENYDDFIDEKF